MPLSNQKLSTLDANHNLPFIQYSNQIATLSSGNKIIEAANPVILFCARIIQGYRPTGSLYEAKLSQDLTLFTSRCKSSHYDSRVIQICSNILIGTIKCILSKNNIQIESLSEKNLVENFDIENILLANPENNIEAIEFIYICYCLGFTGISTDIADIIYKKLKLFKDTPSKNVFITNKKLPKKEILIDDSAKLKKYMGIFSITSTSMLTLGIFLLNENFVILNQHLQSSLMLLANNI